LKVNKPKPSLAKAEYPVEVWEMVKFDADLEVLAFNELFDPSRNATFKFPMPW
jgi:hypothetical protein